MRINFKRGLYQKDWRRCIFRELIHELCEEYDLDSIHISDWVINNVKGKTIFIDYLTEKGYKAKSYSWPTEKDPCSYGIEFDDNDPLIIALKLKHSGENT